jgi:hypothetical protein
MPGLTNTVKLSERLNRPDVPQDVREVVFAVVEDLVSLNTKFNAVLAKLDADGGVTDTNYAALQGSTLHVAV